MPDQTPTSDSSSGDGERTLPLGEREPAVYSTDFQVISDEPQAFGEYDLLEEIGSGGMGRVYKARHRNTGRIVALKTLLPRYLSTAGLVARFRKEANSAAQLDHPGIVPVHEFGEADGKYFFTMALVEGQGLDKRLRQGPLDNRRAARIVEKAAEAVAYAHSRGVIHRDMKPGNILIDEHDNIKVTDFGLARRLREVEEPAGATEESSDLHRGASDLAGLTKAGAIVGTPGFMSPEQARGLKDVGPAADIWALGAVLYACLTGRAPFIGADPVETLMLTLEADPVPPDEMNPDADPDLVDICLRCLEKDPKDRFGSAAELAQALARWRVGHQPWRGWEGHRSAWGKFLINSPEVVPLVSGLIVNRLTNTQEALFVGCTTAGIQLIARKKTPGSLGLTLTGLTLCVASLPASGPLVGEGMLAGAIVSVVSMVGLMFAIVSGIPELTVRIGRWSPQSWAVVGFLAGLFGMIMAVTLSAWLKFSASESWLSRILEPVEWGLGLTSGGAFTAALGLAFGAILGQIYRRLEVFGPEVFPAFLLSVPLMGVLAAGIMRIVRPLEPTQAGHFSALGPGPALALSEQMLTRWVGDSEEARISAAAASFCIKFLFYAVPMAVGAVIGSLVARWAGDEG